MPPDEATKRDVIDAIYSNPCITQFDCKKRPYLLTDFSRKGFDYDLCQPDSDDPDSMTAMHREMEGSECEFLLLKSTLRLRFAGFGSRITQGHESSLHSHLGEACALDCTI